MTAAAASPTKQPLKRPSSVSIMKRQQSDADKLDYEMVDELMASWRIVKKIPNYAQVAGELLFRKIFELAPGAFYMYTFAEKYKPAEENIANKKKKDDNVIIDESMYSDPRFIAHASGVVSMLDAALNMIGPDLEPLKVTLEGLGAKHVSYGVLPAHYGIVGQALLSTLEAALGDDIWTKELCTIWTKVYTIVSTSMMKGAQHYLEEKKRKLQRRRLLKDKKQKDSTKQQLKKKQQQRETTPPPSNRIGASRKLKQHKEKKQKQQELLKKKKQQLEQEQEKTKASSSSIQASGSEDEMDPYRKRVALMKRRASTKRIKAKTRALKGQQLPTLSDDDKSQDSDDYISGSEVTHDSIGSIPISPSHNSDNTDDHGDHTDTTTQESASSSSTSSHQQKQQNVVGDKINLIHDALEITKPKQGDNRATTTSNTHDNDTNSVRSFKTISTITTTTSYHNHHDLNHINSKIVDTDFLLNQYNVEVTTNVLKIPHYSKIVEDIYLSWDQIKAIPNYAEVAGIILFKKIFEIAPAAKSVFHFTKGFEDESINEKDMDVIYTCPIFLTHARKVINMVDAAINMLGPDLEPLSLTLQDLGMRHVSYGVLPEFYPIVGQALIHTLKTGLGEKHWNKKLQAGWETLFTFISTSMLRGAKDFLQEKHEEEETKGTTNSNEKTKRKKNRKEEKKTTS